MKSSWIEHSMFLQEKGVLYMYVIDCEVYSNLVCSIIQEWHKKRTVKSTNMHWFDHWRPSDLNVSNQIHKYINTEWNHGGNTTNNPHVATNLSALNYLQFQWMFFLPEKKCYPIYIYIYIHSQKCWQINKIKTFHVV